MAKLEPRSEALPTLRLALPGDWLMKQGGVVAFSRLLLQASGLSVDSRGVVNLGLLPPNTH